MEDSSLKFVADGGMCPFVDIFGSIDAPSKDEIFDTQNTPKEKRISF